MSDAAKLNKNLNSNANIKDINKYRDKDNNTLEVNKDPSKLITKSKINII
jgi:hypothetical protein